MPKTTPHKFGWRPSAPDHRDFIFTAPHTGPLPTHIDLRTGFPTLPYDQGQLGSCTANAIAGALQFDQAKQKAAVVMPSRLFIYYSERVIEGTVKSDSGATIRDSVKAVNDKGYPAEKTWPYNIAKFATKPKAAAFTEAAKREKLVYKKVAQNIDAMRATLASGYVINIGFSVFESFESLDVSRTGIVPMPAPDESLLGGHAVVVCGYDDATKRFTCRNSWGTSWGNAGYFTIPYAYLASPDLAGDFWVVQHTN